MKCSNIPGKADCIPVHMLEIHWLNAQFKCLQVSGNCMAPWHGIGQFGAHKEWYCIMWCGEA